MPCYVWARTRPRKDGRGTVSQLLRGTVSRTRVRDGRRRSANVLAGCHDYTWASAATARASGTDRPALTALNPTFGLIVVMGVLGLGQPGIEHGLAAAGERRLVATGNVAWRTVWRAASGSAPGALRSAAEELLAHRGRGAAPGPATTPAQLAPHRRDPPPPQCRSG